MSADEHGAAVIPPAPARKLPAPIDLCMRREAVILKLRRNPGFTVEKLNKAIAKSKRVH